MLNIKKICRAVLMAAFVCTFAGSAMAQISGSSFLGGQSGQNIACSKDSDCGEGKICVMPGTPSSACQDASDSNTAQKAEEQAKDVVAGTNAEQAASTVTGCSSNYGLFSGLIDTGRRIFKGLRDLIYVVAGFGIIGVAVGGFFGNLNWKWLGAIVIALVVIATTGEIINMITGCENFTKAMIEDTLK